LTPVFYYVIVRFFGTPVAQSHERISVEASTADLIASDGRSSQSESHSPPVTMSHDKD